MRHQNWSVEFTGVRSENAIAKSQWWKIGVQILDRGCVENTTQTRHTQFSSFSVLCLVCLAIHPCTYFRIFHPLQPLGSCCIFLSCKNHEIIQQIEIKVHLIEAFHDIDEDFISKWTWNRQQFTKQNTPTNKSKMYSKTSKEKFWAWIKRRWKY